MSAPSVARAPGESPPPEPPRPRDPDPVTPPPAAVAAASVTRATAATAAAVGSITGLIIRAGDRAANGDRLIQVVADTGGANATYGRRRGPLAVSGSFNTPATREVSVEVQTNGAGRKQTALSRSSDAPSDWQTGATRTYTVDKPSDASAWLCAGSPAVYYVHGRGADDVRLHGRVESYPSAQYEISVSLDIFQEWLSGLDERIRQRLRRRFGPFEVRPELTRPSGSLTARWGWCEHTDWRAAFKVEVEAALRPLLGFGIELRLSLLHIAGSVGLTACGLPTNIASMLMEYAQDYLGDVYVGIGVGVSVSIAGSGNVKFFPTGGSRGAVRITPGIDGELSFVVGARVGSEYFVSAELRGRATVGIGCAGAIEANRDGIFFCPEVTWPGLTLSLTLTLRAGDTVMDEYSGSWRAIDGGTLWEPDAPIQLAGG